MAAGVVPRIAARLKLLAGEPAEGVGSCRENPLEALVDTTLVPGQQLVLEAGTEDIFRSGKVALGYVFTHFVKREGGELVLVAVCLDKGRRVGSLLLCVCKEQKAQLKYRL